MVVDHHGLYHIHKRKRKTKRLDPYPHPKKWVRLIDTSIYFIAIVIPLMAIPQILKLWSTKSSQDISLITWGAFLISALMWLTYSIVHKDKPLIINSVLWVVLELVVVLEIILFR